MQQALNTENAAINRPNPRQMETPVKFIVTALHGALIGAVIGCIWAVAPSSTIWNGFLIGVIAGGSCGVVMTVVGIAAALGGNVNARETMFVSGSLMMILYMAAGAVAVVVVRFIW